MLIEDIYQVDCPGEPCEAQPGELCRNSHGETRTYPDSTTPRPHSLRWLNAHAGPLHRCVNGPCTACWASGWMPAAEPEGLLGAALIATLESNEWAARHFGLSCHARDVAAIVAGHLTPRLAGYAEALGAIADDLDETAADTGRGYVLDAFGDRLRTLAREISTADATPRTRAAELIAERDRYAGILRDAVPLLRGIASARTGLSPRVRAARAVLGRLTAEERQP